MKKLFPILVVLVLVSTACQLGGGQAQPTPLAVATAFPTNPPAALNPTAQPSGNNQAAGSERTTVDGMTAVFIPAGTFQMGGIDSNAETDEKPVHQVTVRSFWLDKFEVTNGMYVQCVKAGVCPPPQQLKSETRDSYFNNPDFNDYPVVYVTSGDASAYCKWAGRRLPSEAEWERAARGDTINTYPWGDQRPDATLANFNYMLGDTARVGSYPAGASPFGALDMAGNVAEWTNDYYDGNYYANGPATNPTGPLARSQYFGRVVRGGTYADAARDIRTSNRAQVVGSNLQADPGSTAYFGDFSPRIGFRCASDN
ncbi:MAG: SUMF1/EgtB/PvdO family nonheme iron enzyme [Chloroflexi bacterium]|nr:SUMF1/EgtB/PvdO family nonheme iron enzyme [Chloroflexota bacterium]